MNEDKCGTCLHLEKCGSKWYCLLYKVFKSVHCEACIYYDLSKQIKD